MNNRGLRAQVILSTREKLSGWVYAENDLGTYLAADTEGKNIRFIPGELLEVISYDRKSPRAQFSSTVDIQSQVEKLQKEIAPQLSKCLQRVDYNRIRNLVWHFRAISHRFRIVEAQMNRGQSHEALSLLLDAKDAFAELVDEVIRVGLDKVLLNNHDQIRLVLSRDTLPHIDALETSVNEIDKMIEDARTNDQLRETDFGKRLSEQITSARLQEFEAKAATKNKSHWGLTALKLIAAGGKLTIGGGLAGVNISAGVFAGVISAIPTLGLGTVAAAVAIAGSTYTGLSSGCDALRDIATALEK